MALRSHVNGNEPFTKLLQTVKQTTLEAYAHQEVPFEKVVDAVVQGRDMSRHPLFQVLFSLQNTPEIPELKLGSLSLTTEGQEHVTSRFDIAFMVRETATGIRGVIEYNTDLYTEERISSMAIQFSTLLGSVVKAPGQAVGELRIITQEEEQAIQAQSRHAVTYPEGSTVPGLISEIAKKTPTGISVVYEGQQLSYGGLEERTNQLGHYLREKGVKEGHWYRY
jgi:non-ribosomal peptide synthetase component F